MALLDSEIYRIKAELGFNVLSIGAEPYFEISALFDIIQDNLSGGASTTSSTSVASPDGSPATLTLASVTGFTAGARVAVDVDARQEFATIASLSGSSIVVQLSKVHSGTYPVVVDGPEVVVRQLLQDIEKTKAKLVEQYGSGALRQVDEIQWYDARGKTSFGIIGENLAWYREQLAAALGIDSMWSVHAAGGQTMAVY